MPGVDTLVSMKVFRQVVESGSFVAAAERLSLSTAMTSKHVTHLEKHLATRLLNRSSRSLSLTESGTLFYERCKVILAELEGAELEVGSLHDAPHGTLKVTVSVLAERSPDGRPARCVSATLPGRLGGYFIRGSGRRYHRRRL